MASFGNRTTVASQRQISTPEMNIVVRSGVLVAVVGRSPWQCFGMARAGAGDWLPQEPLPAVLGLVQSCLKLETRLRNRTLQ